MQLHRLGHAFGEITGHALVKWRSRYREIIGHDAVKYPLRSPQPLGGDKLSRSSKLFEIIDLTTVEQTIYHMEIYEDLFAQGECWASGMAKESIRVPPVESLSYKNYLFLKNHLGFSD